MNGGDDDDDLYLAELEGDEAEERDDLLRGAPARRRGKLTLPSESAERAPSSSSAADAPDSGPPGVDGWVADRLRRSSLPPEAAQTLSSVPVRVTDERAEAESAEQRGDVFDLVRRSASAIPSVDLVSEMAERFALNDFSGALRAAELVLGQEPDSDAARHYAQQSRSNLEAMYASRLTAQGQVPVVDVPESELRWLGLDPQSAFLLSRIDGAVDFEAVVDVSGMERLDALKVLVELVESKVIRMT